MIDQLDSRRAQVYIESMIVEVTGDNAADFGFQWQGLIGEQRRQQRVVGGTNFSTGALGNILGTDRWAGIARPAAPAPPPAQLGEGLNIGLRPATSAAPTAWRRSRASCRRQANTNIVSTPNLVTLDNEEAKIVVGSNVPFITGQFTNTGTATTNPFQTIERKDVGITLRIRPQIGENGTIRMTIFQEASSLSLQVAPGTQRRPDDQQALDRVERRRRRRPDHRARRPDRGPLHRQHVEGAAARRHAVRRRAVPQREPRPKKRPT